MAYTKKPIQSTMLAAGLMLAIAGTSAIAQSNGALQETQPAGTTNQADLPSIEKLTEMTIEAIGGRENIEKILTLHTVMEMDMDGMKITMDNKWSRAGGRITTGETPFGNTEMGTDGTVAWSRMPDGSYIILGEDHMSQLDSQASMHMGMLDLKQLKKSMETMEVVGREEFNDRMAYKVKYKPKGAQGHGFMYFDASDGMPLGMKQTQSTPMGEQTTVMTLGDWKTVEGVRFFHNMSIEAPGMTDEGKADMKVTTLEVNKLDEALFELPAAVKEMVANSSGDDEDGGEAATPEIKLEDLPEDYRERAKKTIEQMKMNGKEAIARSLPQLESALSSLPEGGDKLTMQYVIQELKKVK